jgi:hypothetical protein
VQGRMLREQACDVGVRTDAEQHDIKARDVTVVLGLGVAAQVLA